MAPPGGRRAEEWGEERRSEDFWRSSEDFFFCLFVKSPLWPQGTSARLIPGLPGVEGKEGVWGSKV